MPEKKAEIEFIEEEVEIPTEPEALVEEVPEEMSEEAPEASVPDENEHVPQTKDEQMFVLAHHQGVDQVEVIGDETHIWHQDGTKTVQGPAEEVDA